MQEDTTILQQIQQRWGPEAFQQQAAVDGIPTLWLAQEQLVPVMEYLTSIPRPYHFFYDLCGTGATAKVFL